MKLWIARDKDETLWLFKEYPIKKEELFYPTADITGRLTYFRSMLMDIFPEVTFENSPQEVELKLVEDIVNIEEYNIKTEAVPCIDIKY